MSQTQAAYTIRTDKLNLTIAILDISSLHVHEETIPQLLLHMASSIKRDGYVKDPIIVDKKTLTVLDGVHRIAALEKLRIPRIPVCLVDYNDPNIKVSNWFRTITGTSNLEAAIRAIKLPQVTIETNRRLNISNIGTSPNAAAIKLRNTTFLIRSSFTTVGEAYDLIKKIESKLRSNRLRIRYETETDALQDLAAGSVDAVICTPKLTKKKIINLAHSGKILAAKTTRHVIPARPMRLNVPIRLLKSNKKPLVETNEELRDLLQGKRLRTLPPGTVFDGRRYEEKLYVFEEPQLLITIKVKLLGVFRGISGKSEVTLRLNEATVRSAIELLSESLPPKARALLIDRHSNDPRPNALILLNGKEINVLEGLETSVKNGDELMVIPIAHGG